MSTDEGSEQGNLHPTTSGSTEPGRHAPSSLAPVAASTEEQRLPPPLQRPYKNLLPFGMAVAVAMVGTLAIAVVATGVGHEETRRARAAARALLQDAELEQAQGSLVSDSLSLSQVRAELGEPGPFDFGAAVAALDEAEKAALGCWATDTTESSAHLTVTFDHKGHVIAAQIQREGLQPATALCMEKAFRNVRIASFSGDDQVLHRIFIRP